MSKSTKHTAKSTKATQVKPINNAKPDTSAEPDDSLSARMASLTHTEVAQLGLRNGMTPSEIAARIKQVFNE